MAEPSTIARPYAAALFQSSTAADGVQLAQQLDALAVKGAEQILRREVSPAVHAELLNRLQTEL